MLKIKNNIFDVKNILVYILFMNFNNVSGQTITVNINEYTTFCAGNTFSIPVSLNGNWATNNKFRLRLTEQTWSGDTTITIEASNNSSPLLFQIPVIYASNRKKNNYYFKLTIESTNPIVISNQLNATMGLLPTIQIGDPVQSDNILNEYINPETFKNVKYTLYNGDDRNYTFFKINDSLSSFSSNSGAFAVRPMSTKSYYFTKVNNLCGNGQILPPNLATVKVNAFKIKITNISPTIVCEDRKFQVNIDYNGNFSTNSLFFIEIANMAGDSIRLLPTTILDNRNFTATLDNSFIKGKYLVRFRATSPDIATNYVPLVVAGPPQINLQWVSGAVNPIDYKNQVWLRITVQDNGGVKPLGIKLSDGQIIKRIEQMSSGYMTDLFFTPEKSLYYKVDSLITSCGVSKNFSVTGERDLIIKKDFYVEDLHKRDFCAGEKIRFKLKSDYPFGNNNNFTAKLYLSGNIILSSTVSQVGDSLEFTIPPASTFENTFWDMNFKIEASSPRITSTMYWENLKIHRKPEINVSNSSKTVSLPGQVNIDANVKGENPVFLTLSDGLNESKTQIYTSSSNYERNGYFWVTPMQTTTYYVKSIENACGVTEYNPNQNFAVNVNNSTQRSIHLIKSPTNICMGNTYQIEFLTTGNFVANNEFIVTLTYYANYTTYTYEVGRSSSSPVNIIIPNTIPLVNGAYYCQFTITSTQTESENLPLNNRQRSASIIQNQTAFLNYPYIVSSNTLVAAKDVEILEGETINVNVTSPNTNITEKYNIKINDKWFNHSQYIDLYNYTNNFSILFKPKSDTTLYLNKIDNACGQSPLNDTLRIKVKNYRIRYALIDGGIKCKGNFIDVMIAIEGKLENRPNSFKVYIIPDVNKLLRFEAPISQILESNTYRIQLPDIPYDGLMTFDIVPTQNANLFVKNYNNPQFFLSKIPNVKLTGLDGSSVAWNDGSSTAVTVKVETTNSENLFWMGKIIGLNTSNGTSINVYSRILKPWINANDGNIFELSDVENECGYGITSGTVTVKHCYHNLYLYDYYNYNTSEEFYSDSFIKSNLLNNYYSTIKKYSAKKSIELLPGFKTNVGQTFKAEIAGCEVIR